MKKLILKIVLFSFLIFLVSCKSTNHCNEIYNLMKQQEDAWNNGNIENFMNVYWKNDSLVFIGKSGINYGWDKTFSNYKNSYKTKEQMGTLEFKNLFVIL